MLSTRPEAIIFDWDNTLFDSWDTIFLGWNKVLTHFDLPNWDIARVRASAHLSSRDAFDQFFGERASEAAEVFYKEFDKNQKLELMPHATALLDNIQNSNIPMAIVSNKRSTLLRNEIENLGLNHYFEQIIGSGDLERDKPFPDGIIHVLKELNIKPANVWYVGDTPVDVEAARAASCIPIVVHTKENAESAKCEHFFETLRDLESIIISQFIKRAS